MFGGAGPLTAALRVSCLWSSANGFVPAPPLLPKEVTQWYSPGEWEAWRDQDSFTHISGTMAGLTTLLGLAGSVDQNVVSPAWWSSHMVVQVSESKYPSK